jgi:hypothetical protein
MPERIALKIATWNLKPMRRWQRLDPCDGFLAPWPALLSRVRNLRGTNPSRFGWARSGCERDLKGPVSRDLRKAIRGAGGD